jgi:cytidylate kinase
MAVKRKTRSGARARASGRTSIKRRVATKKPARKAPARAAVRQTRPLGRARANGATNGVAKERPKAKRAVIAISRTLGANAEEIGRAVAQTLGYRYTDDEIIVRAAQKANVSPEAIEAEVERRPSLMSRILKAMARMPLEPGAGGGVAVMAAAAPTDIAGYERLIEEVIRETADEGNVVIFAHGASIALGQRRDVLRVLVTASPEVRTRRIARRDGLTGEQAAKKIDDSDSQRRSYLSRLYKVRAERPTHYDVVLNTDQMTPRQAASIIVNAAVA